MTEQEAKANLEAIREYIENPTKEISTGIAITTLTAGIEAFEKQIPKKPLIIGKVWDNGYECPICGNSITDHNDCKLKYCRECGQKIDWSEEE